MSLLSTIRKLYNCIGDGFSFGDTWQWGRHVFMGRGTFRPRFGLCFVVEAEVLNFLDPQGGLGFYVSFELGWLWVIAEYQHILLDDSDVPAGATKGS